MQKHTLQRQILLALLAGVILAASGCAGYNPAGAQNPNPTVVVVQYVTQVVATVTPAPPTATPLPATEQPEVQVINTGFDPFSVDVYYPLMGCKVASRIHIGDRVSVANNRNGTLGLHMTPNIGDAPVYRLLGGGEILDVVQGPFCQLDSLVWGVVDADGRIAYAAEGNGNNYWLLPMGEKVDKKLMSSAVKTIKKLRMGLPADCIPR